MPILHLFISFQGRIGRLAYAATATIVMIVSTMVLALVGMPRAPSDISIWHLIISVAFAIPHWALSVKRAHDLEKSGWWLFGWWSASIASLALTFASSVLAMSGNLGASVLLILVSGVLGIGAFYQLAIKLLFFAGTIGNNDFGPPSRLVHDLLNDDESELRDAATPLPLMPAAPVRVPAVANSRSAPATAKIITRQSSSRAPQGGFGRRNAMRPT